MRHVFCSNGSWINGRGVHPPWGHDAFPPCFRFPPIFEKFPYFVENFQNFTFSRKISPFSSAKISDDLFLVVDHKFQYTSPLFREIFYSPYFDKFPPVFEKFPCFLHTLCVLRSPLLWRWCIYASPNARTGRLWLMEIVRSLNRSWTYDCLFSHIGLFIRGRSGRNVPIPYKLLNIIFSQCR